MNHLVAPFILLFSVTTIWAVPVDNGVEGDPEIECGDTFIGAKFITRNPFEGHVFVKGRFAEPGCRIQSTNENSAEIKLEFSSCGVQRTRSVNPRGVFVGVTIIITFHPNFITKVDKAYMLQCYYMEADKTVTTEIEVGMLTTAFQTQTVNMPICRYEVLDGGPTGEPVRYARIGDQVYHKWTCDTETVDIFCMIVHSCKVDDGSGDVIELLDEQGCSLDKYLLGNLEYPMDLMAGREAHVFKYADRPTLYFDCQITIIVKEPGQNCKLPECSTPRRSKRNAITRRMQGIEDVDVDPITVSTKQDEIFWEEGAAADGWILFSENDICLNLISFSSYAVINVILVAVSIVLLISSCKTTTKSVLF